MLSWALAYANRGWPVLPLMPGTKRPLTTHGVHDATTDCEQIQHWWRRHPRANIGLACGVAFEAADFDVRVTHGGAVQRSAQAAITRLNHHRLLGCNGGISLTRHGGWQMFFPPAGVGVRHFKHAAVDIIGKGGYVVAPPSVVPPDSGIRGPGRYSWQRLPDLDDPRVAAADWDLWERILIPPRSMPYRRVAAGGSVAALATTVRQAEVGTRNNTLFWALCRAIEQKLAVEAVLAAAAHAGLSGGEIAATLASAYQTVGGRHV